MASYLYIQSGSQSDYIAWKYLPVVARKIRVFRHLKLGKNINSALTAPFRLLILLEKASSRNINKDGPTKMYQNLVIWTFKISAIQKSLLSTYFCIRLKRDRSREDFDTQNLAGTTNSVDPEPTHSGRIFVMISSQSSTQNWRTEGNCFIHNFVGLQLYTSGQ